MKNTELPVNLSSSPAVWQHSIKITIKIIVILILNKNKTVLQKSSTVIQTHQIYYTEHCNIVYQVILFIINEK